MAAVVAIDALLRDPRLWRGQDTPTPALRQAGAYGR